VKDLFVKLWSDRSLIIAKSLNSLLFIIIRNQCLQQPEKQKVRNKYVDSKSLKLQTVELQFDMNERSSLIEQELEEKLNGVMNTLPEHCRQFFMLSRFENKKNGKIAEELDISVNEVEKLISKSLATIRIEMKNYLPLILFLSSH
jgi:RNA polymerase sigma-70 factor (ECF subfamily)